MKKRSLFLVIVVALLTACAGVTPEAAPQTPLPSIAQQPPVVIQSIPTLSTSGWKQWNYDAEYRALDGSDRKVTRKKQWIRDNTVKTYCRAFEFGDTAEEKYVLIEDTCHTYDVSPASPPPTLAPRGITTPQAQPIPASNEKNVSVWTGRYTPDKSVKCTLCPATIEIRNGHSTFEGAVLPKPDCSEHIWRGSGPSAITYTLASCVKVSPWQKMNPDNAPKTEWVEEW